MQAKHDETVHEGESHAESGVSAVQRPSLYDLLMTSRIATMAALRVMMPATVTAVHASNGTLDAQISIMQLDPLGKSIPYPEIKGIPFVTIQGGGVTFTVPILKGDKCLLFFADRCLDNWKISESQSPLPNMRMHDISDGFALVGVNKPNPLSFPSMNATEGGIASTKALVVMDSITGKISIRNNTGSPQSLYVSLSDLLTALTSLVSLLGAMTTATIASGATQASITALSTSITAVQTELTALLF